MKNIAQLVNGRIASQIVKRRLKVDDQIDRLLADIERSFKTTQNELFDLIVSDLLGVEKAMRFELLLRERMRDAKKLIDEKLMDQVSACHLLAVRALSEAIPESWLATRIPPQIGRAIEVEIPHRPVMQYLNFDAGSARAAEILEVPRSHMQMATMLPVRTKSRLTLEQYFQVLEADEPFAFGVPIKPLLKAKLTDEEKKRLYHQLIFPPPTPAEARAIVDNSDWKSRFDRWSMLISNKRAAFNEIVRGFSDGENITQIRKRLEPLVGGVRSAAQRIARTESSRIAEHTNRRTWEPLGDLMVGVQLLAVLDENTRPHHAARNGKIYYFRPVGDQLPISDLPDLPDEPNCRCTSSPVLRPPDSLSDSKTSDTLISNQAAGSLDSYSAQQWFAGADLRQRKKFIGVERYQFVADQLRDIRQPEFFDFIALDGSLLSIDQLKNETVIDRQSRLIAIARQIEDQSRAFREISQRGFETPKLDPTEISGITFSKKVDPTNPESLIGEAIRQRIAKGVRTEKDVREVGSRIRQAMETEELKRLSDQGNRIKKEIEVLFKVEYSGKLTAIQQQRLKELRQDYARLQTQLEKTKQERFFAIMSQIRDFGTDRVQPFKIGSDPNMSRLYAESQRFFPRDWLDKFQASELSVSKSPPGSPSSYNHDTRRLQIQSGGSIAGLPQLVRSTMVHEMFHQAEDTVPGVYAQQKELYQRRTKGSVQRPMSWNRRIKIKRDSWLGSKANGRAEYMGREYPDGYEIGTMAMQGILFGDVPIELDPEVFDLTLGLLASF